MEISKICVVIIASVIILFSSCSKVEDEILLHETDSSSRYFPMNVGNYWIYDEYRVEQGGEVPIGLPDSTYIEKDTLINGNQYFMFLSSSFPQWNLILRDSSGYLVDQLGVIYFCADAIGDTIHREVRYNLRGDTVFAQYRVMQDVPEKFFVPAGWFNVIDASSYNYNPRAISTPKEQVWKNLYAKDVGLIYREYNRFNSPYNLKLVRYHIVK